MTPREIVTPRAVISVAERLGFRFERESVLHALYAHKDGRRIVVPASARGGLRDKTLSALLHELRLDRVEFDRLLRSGGGA